jgi:hypothetical protein
MNTKTKSPANQPGIEMPDPAAVFAAALSLWECWHRRAAIDTNLDFNESYDGLDGLMRVVLRVANQFEAWASRHLNFADLDQPWPCLLQDQFGETCLQLLPPAGLAAFTDHDCLRAAIRLRLPVRLDLGLPVPVDVSAPNPLANSGFREFRIQTVRTELAHDDCVPFTAADDPFDAAFGPPYFALYGLGADRLPEHIADRPTYAEALALAQRLAPGLNFHAS